jgi:hypothetical protein
MAFMGFPCTIFLEGIFYSILHGLNRTVAGLEERESREGYAGGSGNKNSELAETIYEKMYVIIYKISD